MKPMMDETIRAIWADLECQTGDADDSPKRRYRRLDLDRESGIRLSCRFPDRLWELLIEVGTHVPEPRFSFPNWNGMTFDLLQLDVPQKGTWHISLGLENPEHRDVFVSVCSDLAQELRNIDSPGQRRKTLLDFLDRWSHFFERHSLEGLSPERQRGLFGELHWLRRLLGCGIEPATAVESWKGCARAYHDFEVSGRMVEVKSTLSKEPKKVQVSNERQLDDRGVLSLHLLVVSLIQARAGGQSLPELVNQVRTGLSADAAALRKLEHSLHEAGYLDAHAHLYDHSYTVRSEELFRVEDGFPRIVDLPEGLGDLTYSVLVGACRPYQADIEEYLATLRGRIT